MQSTPTPSWLQRNRVGILIAIIAAAIVTFLVKTAPEPPTSATEEKAWLVNSTSVQIDAHQPNLQLFGKVESQNDATLSSPLAADVALIAAREGERVMAGALLIQLDDRDLSLRQQQLEADVSDIRAQVRAEKNRFSSDERALKEEQKLLAIAEQALARQERLKASALTAQERYEQAESQRAQAALAVSNRRLALDDHPSRLQQLQARLARAENALAQVQLDLSRTQVKAPFTAWITHVPVSLGERVQTGQALVELYEPASLEIRAPIPNRYATRVRMALEQGQQISAAAQLHQRALPLRLARLGARVNAASGGVDALFVPADASAASAIGASLGATLTLHVNLPAFAQSVSLPVSALYGENRVYRIVEGRLETVFVEVLGQQFSTQGNNDRVLVAAGPLRSGDRVITTQLPNAIDGLKITERDTP